jgi:flagellar capping protein FliD
MSMNVEAEIRDLKRRVGELEGSFGFLTQQIKSVHKDLLAFQAKMDQQFEKVEGRFDKVDGRFDKMDGRLDLVERGLRNLRTDMPKIVGDAIREVQSGKPRRKP